MGRFRVVARQVIEGAAGPNSIPTDTFVAGRVADAASATRGALDDRFGFDRAIAIDELNTATTLTVGSQTSFAGLMVSVPPGDQFVEIMWQAYVNITAGGAGAISIGCVETTTGVAVDRGASYRGQTYAVGIYTVLHTFTGSVPLDPSEEWRHFRLTGGVYRDAGSSLAAQLSASNPGGGTLDRRTWIKAVSA